MNRRAIPIIAGAFVVGVLIDLPLDRPPFPGYAAAIGLFGCVALILGAKRLLAPLVDRPEDHYPDEAPPDVQPEVQGPLPPEERGGSAPTVDGGPRGGAHG